MTPFGKLRIAGALLLVLGLATFAGAPAALAQEDGAALYEANGCASCHGPQGKQPVGGLMPNIGGQQEAYLVAQMQAFKNLERTSANAEAMWTFAQMLSDEEIQAISAYLAGVE